MDSALHGRRVSLRPANRGFSLQEKMRRYQWSKDKNLQYWSGNIPTADTFEDFCAMIPERDWPRNGRRRSYAILEHSAGFIGMVSCYALDFREKKAELGVYIGEQTLWNRGLGTDAVNTLLAHLFRDLGLEVVHLNTYSDNVRALRSYAKVGFTSSASRRRFRPSIGFYQEVRMSVDRSAFFGHTAATRAPVVQSSNQFRTQVGSAD